MAKPLNPKGCLLIFFQENQKSSWGLTGKSKINIYQVKDVIPTLFSCQTTLLVLMGWHEVYLRYLQGLPGKKKKQHKNVNSMGSETLSDP